MKGGLDSIPSPKFLEKAYEKLLHEEPTAPSISFLCKCISWSRFDPRLAEILVGYFAIHWTEISPLELRGALQREPWPIAARLLFEFSRKEVPKKSRKIFDHWIALVTDGFTPAKNEQFFIGLRELGGELMVDDARFSLEEYRRHGFLSRENLSRKTKNGTLSSETRAEILNELLEKSPIIRTSNYWQAIGKCVSRRQAERDLRSHPLLRPFGRTKGRHFSFKQLPKS